jgi:hypothetical protein
MQENNYGFIDKMYPYLPVAASLPILASTVYNAYKSNGRMSTLQKAQAAAASFQIASSVIPSIGLKNEQKRKARQNRKELDRGQVRDKIEFFKRSDIKNYEVFNFEYKDYVTKLQKINDKIGQITGTQDERIQALMDELKYTVIFKHFEKADDNDFTLANMAGVGKWCGSGTNVWMNLERERPEDLVNSYKIDRICRQHDINYLNAKGREDIHKADVEMLLSILDTFVLKGIKPTIYKLYNPNDLNQVLDTVKDYLFESIEKVIEEPSVVTLGLSSGFSTAFNVLGNAKLYEYLTGERKLFSKTTAFGLASDFTFLRDRVLGFIGFGAILSKLLYDTIVGKEIYYDEDLKEYTNSVYGWEKTQFNKHEIEYIVRDIQKIQNQKLEEAGYKDIDFENLVIDEPEKLISQPEEEEEEEEEEYAYDAEDETDLIDILDKSEQQLLTDIMNMLKPEDLETTEEIMP